MNTPDPRATPETHEGGYGAPSPADELPPAAKTEPSHAQTNDTTANNPDSEPETVRPSDDADLDAANTEPQPADRDSFSSETDQEASGDTEQP